MSHDALQIIHGAMLIVLCALCGVLAFCTSKKTPKSVRMILSLTPFLAVVFLGEKVSGAYQAYVFDVLLLGALIVYVAIVIVLISKINFDGTLTPVQPVGFLAHDRRNA